MWVQLCGKGRSLTGWQGDKQGKLIFLSLTLRLKLDNCLYCTMERSSDLIYYVFLTNWTVFMYQTKKDVESECFRFPLFSENLIYSIGINSGKKKTRTMNRNSTISNGTCGKNGSNTFLSFVILDVWEARDWHKCYLSLTHTSSHFPLERISNRTRQKQANEMNLEKVI